MPVDDYEQFPPIEGNPSHTGGIWIFVVTLVLAVALLLAIL